MSENRKVDQASATAGQDIVGGDKTVRDQSIHHHYAPAAKTTPVELLLAKLQKEMDENTQVQAMIEDLRYYYGHVSHDGIAGLEAKLAKGNRAHEIHHALEKKELFVKLLERWSLYATAQEIFVQLLARAEYEYSMYVLPQIGTLSEIELNQQIGARIVEPIVADCGASVFKLNHGVALGMFYWLAEQCFVRWHA